MENINKIDLNNVTFRLMAEEKFCVKGRGTYIAGRISLGKISSGEEVIISDKTGTTKGRTKVIVEFFCSSKMKDKDTAYENMNIALMLKDTTVNEVDVNDYLIML